jgi:hypothetical protein
VTRSTVALVLSAFAVASSLGGARAPGDQELSAPLRLTAWAVNMSNIATGANSTVDIAIERWSTEDERQKLITTFKEKGASKLLDTLQDLKRVGYIRLPTSIGYDLHFARQVALDEGGQKILIATDRKIGFAEARNQPRTIDYPFTLIEIHLSREGKGEGKMSLATKISYNKKENVLELENYSTEPVRLQNVKLEKRK